MPCSEFTPELRIESRRGSVAVKSARTNSERLRIGLVALALLALFVALVTRFGWGELKDQLAALDPALAILAMATLPLFGFSIAVVYVVAGLKFGFWLGGAVIAGITAVHLVASHWIARSLLRKPLQRVLARYQRHLPVFPASEEASVALMVALVPGPPYFARNYLLALTNIPLWRYFWICLPVYTLRSYLTLGLGDLGRDFDRQKLIILVAVYVVKLAICALLWARLRRRLQGVSPTR